MNQSETQMFFNEITMLRGVEHPNILKIFEYFEDHKRYYLISESCLGGDLFEELLERKKFSEKDTAILVQTVLACINYCHKRKIVHRDIKLENMLLEKTMKDQFDQIKVIDFGTSATCAHDQRLEEKIGSPYYIAPEVLAKSYTNKCDIWSIGVCAYLLISGEPPFNGKDHTEILAKVREGTVKFDQPIWQTVSEPA